MGTIAFKQLPMTAKVAIGVAFNNAWWSIVGICDRSARPVALHAVLP